MEAYFLWRLSMLLVTVFVFSAFGVVYKLINKVRSRRIGKACER